MIQITVLLEIKDKALFKTFESKAIKVMEKYDGKLRLAYEPIKAESSLSNIGEVHYLEFPDIDAYKRYRRDPELEKLSGLRADSILKTNILVSGENIIYE